ncbi:MAG: DNA polymerase III subunit beta [Bacilli bacterium]|nr:DNA polymerase III subunit beta [Bacilli bacterium]
MRFTIDKENFLKAISAADHAIAAKNAIPLMANLKIELDERGLEITGSNADMTIRSTVPYRNGEKEIIRNAGLGATLINAHLLTEVVRRMEGSEVSLEVIDESIAKLDDGRSSFKLNCVRADEYPDIDLELNGTLLELPCADFVGLVEQSAFAASTKEQRPVLTALNLEAGNQQLVATATDSARLARKSIAIESEAKFRCNVPARIIGDVVRLFEEGQLLTLSVSDAKILFAFGNTVVSSRLVSGDYPVTSAIIPHTFNFYLEANSQELLNAMSRVSLLSSERESVVKLSMREDEVEISAKSEASGSASEHLRIFSYTGERLNVSFNCLFVMDAIKALKAEDVTLCFQAEMKPFVVKNPKDESVIELITPMRTY